MSSVGFLASSRVLIVAGKGGVGKTTVGATVGVAAARAGADVLLVELEGRSALGATFGVTEVGYEATPLARFAGGGRLDARRITPEHALEDYLDTSGLSTVTNRLARTGAVDVVATAAPGIRDLLALGKIRQLDEASAADLIVVDAPAAGHAITFLTAPRAIADSVRSGPVQAQAQAALAMLGDETRCRVLLVTTPEETPVIETIEAAYSLEEEVGVHLAPVVVNGMWPHIDGLAAAVEDAHKVGVDDRAAVAAARFRLRREAAQEAQRAHLAAELPLPQIVLPQLFATELGRPELERLADAFDEQVTMLTVEPTGSAGSVDVRP